jgi:hypothetical protein
METILALLRLLGFGMHTEMDGGPIPPTKLDGGPIPPGK